MANIKAINKTVAVYIHFPFCIQKCAYCDFFSVRRDKFYPVLDCSNEYSEFTKKIIFDLTNQKKRFSIEAFSSVYIGGGTPSLMSPKDVFALASSVSKLNNNAKIEFSIEVNPDSLTEDFINAAVDGGVNRFSMGVQTFNTELLKSQKRIGSKQVTLNALDLLKNLSIKKGFKFSCDLIAGFVGQTTSILSNDIKTILDFDVGHISLYSLCTHNSRADAENDFVANLWLHGSELLEKYNYTRYEISNFARSQEDECFHNKAYWNLDSYLGIGPSAVGTIIYKTSAGQTKALRTECIKNINDWLNLKIEPYTTENINTKTLIEEVMMMGFRLKQGINIADFYKRFNLDLTAIINRTIQSWQTRGFLKLTPTHCFLTKKGLVFLNQFLIDAFTELDTSLCLGSF